MTEEPRELPASMQSGGYLDQQDQCELCGGDYSRKGKYPGFSLEAFFGLCRDCWVRNLKRVFPTLTEWPNVDSQAGPRYEEE